MNRFYFLILSFVLCAVSICGQNAARLSSETFRRNLLADVTQAVTREHAKFDVLRGKKQAIDRGATWVVPAMTILYAETKDRKFLEWAKQDLLAMVDGAKLAGGEAKPILSSFRNVLPFCEAYLALREAKMLDADEQKRVAEQIRVSMRAHYAATDYGAHNRGLIDGAGFLVAAQTFPDEPEAAKWRGYGEALIADSWGKWSVEDSSIYNPFWLFYLLRVGELKNKSDELMSLTTTRFYFEQYLRLMMPNAMLPDWGDGDWTHSWAWNFSTMTRAAAAQKNPFYQDFAVRHYDYYRRLAIKEKTDFLRGDELYAAATALRWLDAKVEPQARKFTQSEEVVDDLISKKIAFRNDFGAKSSFLLLNYRDEIPSGRNTREYLNQQLAAFEEKPHHGHADENSVVVLMDDETVLLADGGYRRSFNDGWRADFYHNRVVARTGLPVEGGDAFSFLQADKTYHFVRTEKIHFETFGAIDYSRTSLTDEERGYAGDRIIVFVPSTGMYLIVDNLLVTRAGTKTFVNVWHPDQILKSGADYVVARPDRIPIRKEFWRNERNKELLIQFIDNRDKPTATKEIDRRFNPSKTFYQSVSNYFSAGQRVTFVTVLRPHAVGKFDEKMLSDVQIIENSSGENRSLGLRLNVGAEKLIVAVKLDRNIGLTNYRGRPMFDQNAGTLSYGALRTDADFAFVWEKTKQLDYGFAHASRIDWNNKTLFEMPVNKEIYQGATEFRVLDARDKMPRYRETIERK